LQGFGRVSLKNILPYPGIEDQLQIILDESLISSGYRMTYTVQVTSPATLPLKVTLVWMDPLNSAITTKMLLNNLDLQIREVSTSKTFYGNGVQGDEYNNVSDMNGCIAAASCFFFSLTLVLFLRLNK
jgi:hypothetical protein